MSTVGTAPPVGTVQKLEPKELLLEPEGLLEWGLDLLPRAIRLPRARLVHRPAKLLASSRVLSLVGQTPDEQHIRRLQSKTEACPE